MGNNISYQTAEYGKFLQLGANTAFPPISVVRLSYPDTSSAFPENSGAKPLSSIDVYPKYAVLTHLTNPDDIKISLSAENINVSLDGLEDLGRIQNAIGFIQSFQLSALATYVDDLEKNTYDTASACDDSYHELVKINNVGIKYSQDSGNTDAFGRLRASMPTTLFDSKTLHTKASLFWSQTAVGNGADVKFTSEQNDASVTLSAAGVGAYAIRQTTQRFNYQPGKCVWVGSYITLANGERIQAKNLVGKTFELLTLDDKGKIIKKKAKAELNAFEPIYKITTKNGNEVIRNSKHPFWIAEKTYNTFWKKGNNPSININGWTELKDIKCGNLIAITEKLNVFGKNNSLSIDDAKIIGYLLGDGCIIKGVGFTQQENKQLEEFKKIVENKNHKIVEHGKYGYRVVRNTRKGNEKNYFIELLKSQNIFGHRSWEKHIPDSIFNSPKKIISAFLSRLYSTDGWACNKEIGITSVSKDLTYGIKELLLKFGIHGYIRSSIPLLNKKPCRRVYTLFLYGKQDIEIFSKEIGIYGKEKAVEKVLEKVSGTKESTKQLFKYKNLPDTLRWDVVKDIEHIGEDWTVAIEVEDTHTYLTSFYEHNSQLVLFTGILNPVSNAIKRYGLFQSLTAAPYEPNCGLYFETQIDSASSIAVVQQNDSFLVSSLSARRENWNIDKLDGTGPSGKVLNLSAANIFLIDYEWLGVGRVRYGTVIDGQICYCHAFNNAGNVQGAYIRTPNLPVRAEVRQTGAGTASMKMICCSVMSEGGSDFTGVTRAVDSGTALTIGANARRAILGVRLQFNKLDSVNEVLNASVAVLASNNQYAPYKYEFLHNPYTTTSHGVTGGTWSNVDANSNFQYWRGNNEPYNGTVIAAGFGSVGSVIDLSGYRFEKFLRMGCSVAGVRDELYLVITPLDANNGVFGSLTFIESD